MTGVATPLMLAHLMGESWHVEDVLLYGGASVGVALGVGLFLWGRVERRHEPDPSAKVRPDGKTARTLLVRESPPR